MNDNKVDDVHESLLEECQRWIKDNTDESAEPKMIWCDVETSGLDYDSDMLLEIGFIVTNEHGKIVPDGVFQSVVHVPTTDNWIEAVDPYVRDMHTRSRLIEELEVSWPELENLEIVENKAVKFLKGLFGEDMASLRLPICGSSVGFDKRWIESRLPNLSSLFGYRVVDISSFRIVAEMLNPDLNERPTDWRGFAAHRVIPDMIDTIGEYLTLTGQTDASNESILKDRT